MAGPLHLLGCGLCTPLGLERGSTMLELSAGADVFEETAVLDARGHGIRASRLELLPASASRSVRMAELGTHALTELLNIARALQLSTLPVMLALPEDDGGGRWSFAPIWAQLEARAARAGVRLELLRHAQALPEGTRRSGAAGLFQLMTLADTMLDAGHDPLVLGAIDSRCDPSSLTELAAARRLIDGGTEGYMPGEGAGFVLLTRRSARRGGFSIIAHTHDVEPRSFRQRAPSDALGLTRAFRRLRLGPPQIQRVARALSCQWDAGYWGREFVAAYLRNAELLPEPLRVDYVSEQLGNPGAAAPVLQLARALTLGYELAQQQQAPAQVLVYGCAEHGELGACVVEARPESRLLTQPMPSLISPRLRGFERDRLADHLEQLGSLLVSRHDDLRRAVYAWPEVVELDRRLHTRLWAAAERGRRMGAATASLLEHDDPDIVRACAYLLLAAGSAEQGSLALARMREFAEDEDELPLWRSTLAHALHGKGGALLEPEFEGAVLPLQLALLDLFDELEHRPLPRLLAVIHDPASPAPLRWRALRLLTRAGPAAALETVEALWRAAPEDPRLLELMLWLGRSDALDALRLARARGSELSAAHYEVWSLAPGTRDAAPFFELAERSSLEPAHVWALSSYGSVRAVPALLAALEQPALALDAAIGLERMLGAGWIDSVWVPDADALDPEREGESRLQPVLDPQRWRELWAQQGGRFDPRVRYRCGRPLDHRARVDELARPAALPSMRAQALRELCVATGTPLHLGLNWPIDAQHHALARLRAWLEAL